MNQHLRDTIGVLAIVLFIGAMIFAQNIPHTQEPQTASVIESIENAPAQPFDEAAPVRLRIPEIDVDTSFVTLGVDENNEIEIPDSYEEVGWYQHGPTPGELGPSVVLGHVDSTDGPGVFYSLGQLDPGDTIEVDREDGTTATFEIISLKRYAQENFPTSLVYGNIDHAGLRLITCSGSYDRELERYDHNLVVYAELIEE